MSSHERGRQSIDDIAQELHYVFNTFPSSHLNQSGDRAIPADALPDVLREFSEHYGVELLADNEMEMLRALLASNPGIEVTPQVLLQFIAEKTRNSPRDSPGREGHAQQYSSSIDGPENTSLDDELKPTLHSGRGRDPFTRGNTSSRSSSQSSRDISHVSSRPPSVPPKTPVNAPPSAFDTSRRQRTTPLSGTAPSSWVVRRPAPAGRRKSMDGGSNRALSDTESYSSNPTSFGRTPSRTRAPSNPTSPQSVLMSPSYASPPFPRPHSRTQSHSFNTIGFHYISPDRDRDRNPLSPNPRSPEILFDPSPHYMRNRSGADMFLDDVSSLPLPRAVADVGSDSEDESSLGLVLDRSAVSSTVSLEPHERLDALQKANADLGRKLIEAERTLQVKLQEHDTDLEEMQARLEELKSELTATKREEKELRAKERVASSQMTALESEIAKLQKSLENARTAYQSLQKQYQEQCAESERYRNTLRRRDQELKDLQDAAALQALEAQKWGREHESYEERIATLEGELAIAQQAHAQLDEQKQENLMLKETIDRMRFEMDEMRNSAGGLNAGGGSHPGSQQGSVSRSLGAELLGKMGGQWEMEGSDGEDGLDDEEGEDTEGEEVDVIQKIITRRKKVTGRTNKIEKITEIREFANAWTQYDSSEHALGCAIQTVPEPLIVKSTFATQTEGTLVSATAVQADLQPQPIPRITVDVEIQTDSPRAQPEPEPESSPESSRSSSPLEEEDEAMASSSSTVLPPTPKGEPSHPPDLPPSYTQVTSQPTSPDILELLKKWHNGLSLPIGPLPSGISEDTVEEWRALKEDLGVECSVIDKIIEASARSGPRPPSRTSRFYNVYNTYVYGSGDKDPSGSSGGGAASLAFSAAKQMLICMGASACVYLVMGPYIAAQYTPVGGATYYDRAAWSSFNSMQAPGEGFGYDGTSALWNVLERVGFGAARIAGGWPT